MKLYSKLSALGAVLVLSTVFASATHTSTWQLWHDFLKLRQ